MKGARAGATALGVVMALGGGLGCGVTHLARPVEPGAVRVEASLGGPVVLFSGAPVPTPMSVVSVAYGVSRLVDVHADLHPTALAFGNAGTTLGAAFHPVRSQRGAFTLGADAMGFVRPGDAAWAALDTYAVYAWFLTQDMGVGLGLHQTVALNPNVRYVPAPFVEGWKRFGSFTGELEIRWAAPFRDSQYLVPDWVGLGGTGAISVLLGASWDSQRSQP